MKRPTARLPLCRAQSGVPQGILHAIALPERMSKALLADKGHDAAAIRAGLGQRRITAVIPGLLRKALFAALTQTLISSSMATRFLRKYQQSEQNHSCHDRAQPGAADGQAPMIG